MRTGELPRISVELEGDAAQLNPKPITAAVLAGLMRRFSQAVNMVNAPFLAKERGMEVREVRNSREGAYNTLVRVTVATRQGERSVAGTLFGKQAPRLVEIKSDNPIDIAIEEVRAGKIELVAEDAD